MKGGSKMRKKDYEWEACPECGSISIAWRGDRGCFRCLNRACQHEWREWPGGPKTYDEIKNKYLRVSLPPRSPIPYVNLK